MPPVNRQVGGLSAGADAGLILQSTRPIERTRWGAESSTLSYRLRNADYPALAPDVGTLATDVTPGNADSLAAFAHLAAESLRFIHRQGSGIGILEVLYRGAIFPPGETHTAPHIEKDTSYGSVSLPFFYNGGNSIGYQDVSYRAMMRTFRYVSETDPTEAGTPLFAGTLGTNHGTVTADAGTDVLTRVAHGLKTAQRVRLSTTGTLPAPLVAGTDYYLHTVTADTFKLATSAFTAINGSAAIDITTAGSGVHTLVLMPPPPLVDGNSVALPYVISYGGGALRLVFMPSLVVTKFSAVPCGNVFEVTEADEVRIVEMSYGDAPLPP